jgi:hypothetical protein
MQKRSPTSGGQASRGRGGFSRQGIGEFSRDPGLDNVGSAAGPPPAQRLGPGEILIEMRACGPDDVDSMRSTRGLSPPFAAAARGCVDAAGTVTATGARVTRFAVGDEVFGHFSADSCACDGPPRARTDADGAHVELRPDGLDPLAAPALVHCGLVAKTIHRVAALAPGQSALVIGASCQTGAILLGLLAESGARVIDGAGAPVQETAPDPVVEALTSHPDLDLLVDLISFGEPYFITATARHGTIVSDLAPTRGPGIPRIAISAEPGDLAALARQAVADTGALEVATPAH